jgi:predicted naringenin-chalcone synthase
MSAPSVFIHGLAPRVPASSYPQETIGEILRGELEPGGRGDRLMRKIYRSSGIETRHSVIEDHRGGAGGSLFFDGSTGAFLSPTTGERNDEYVRTALPLFRDTAGEALERSGFAPWDVTHVVTVSCTGFMAPGPDLHIVRELGLAPSVERYHVGFMGCYAAFPALRMAAAFCRSDPDAVVLVVCLELCTLHLEPSEVIDNIIASSVFADGAAGAVVSRRPPRGRGVELIASTTRVAPDSEEHMAWRIGDRGFEMTLSTWVPKILGTHIGELVDGILADAGRTRPDVARWWVHPGGRSILPADALAASRAVLARYGNMSSATILFVIEEALRSGPATTGDLAYAMAFGPGLTVESALFRVV